eukprot:scaffold1307_cov200-Pinguiococcus_pyrenoidosus.AAC.110
MLSRASPRLQAFSSTLLFLACLHLPHGCDSLGASAPKASVYHVINLSNGVEALPALRESGIPPELVGVMRLQSSHCEAQAFEKILTELDHSLLFRLALGSYVCVYDVGSRAAQWPDGNRWVPRAIWWGLEWVRFVLNDVWGLEKPSDKILLRGYNVDDLFRKQLFRLSKTTRTRLKYYRPFVATRRLRLFGAYRPGGTTLDGDKEAYGRIVHFEFGIDPDAAKLPDFGSLDDRIPRTFAVGDAAKELETPSDPAKGVQAWWLEDCDIARQHLPDGYRLYDPYRYMNVGRGRVTSAS